MTDRDPRNAVEDKGRAAAAGLPPLLAKAERIAATVAPGVHGRRRPGRGESFWQFRQYQPGDSVRSIDWRRSGRSDTRFIREYEWEAAQTLWLWPDRTPGMDWTSEPGRLATKAERAMVLAVALACLLTRGGERLGLLGAGRPAMWGGAAPGRLAEMLGQAETAVPLADLPSPLRRTAVVLISDFLMPLEILDAKVRQLSARGVTGHLLQVLDPAEETLPFAGRVRFTGLGEQEGEEVLLGRAEEVRAAYARRLEAQRAGVAAIARGAGWSWAHHRTDHPPEAALLALHAAIAGLDGQGGGP